VGSICISLHATYQVAVATSQCYAMFIAVEELAIQPLMGLLKYKLLTKLGSPGISHKIVKALLPSSLLAIIRQ
jgi:hypothetical protein